MSDNLTEILNHGRHPEISPDIYNELVKIARSALSKSRNNMTLDTSAVISESILKLYNNSENSFASRGHFFALMSQIMRNLIVDYIRQKQSQIRGGHLNKVTMTGVFQDEGAVEIELSQLLDIDNAMEKLSEFDGQLQQLLAMKFYAGLSNPELAKCFNTSESTIKRELRVARAFVKSQLSDYSA